MKEPNIDEHMSRYDARVREAKVRIAAAERRAAIRKLAMEFLMNYQVRQLESRQAVLTRAVNMATAVYDDVHAFEIPDKV